jgi:hypothetical protein
MIKYKITSSSSGVGGGGGVSSNNSSERGKFVTKAQWKNV